MLKFRSYIGYIDYKLEETSSLKQIKRRYIKDKIDSLDSLNKSSDTILSTDGTKYFKDAHDSRIIVIINRQPHFICVKYICDCSKTKHSSTVTLNRGVVVFRFIQVCPPEGSM